jgi:DNA (cytosine-5)-methyltransferase 1
VKPRLLDLYCGAGGAARGYQLAGFHVTGVDNRPQPRYTGDEFVQADALEYAASHAWGFDAIHASPPCYDHTSLRTVSGVHRSNGTGWMLPATIYQLSALSIPYIIENVPRAQMPGSFILCARSFGIAKLRRHRQFLTSWFVMVPPCTCHRGQLTLGVYGDLSRNDRSAGHDPKSGSRRYKAGVDSARELMDCPWMSAEELSQAIPPVYTQFIGEQLLAHLDPPGAALMHHSAGAAPGSHHKTAPAGMEPAGAQRGSNP